MQCDVMFGAVLVDIRRHVRPGHPAAGHVIGHTCPWCAIQDGEGSDCRRQGGACGARLDQGGGCGVTYACVAVMDGWMDGCALPIPICMTHLQMKPNIAGVAGQGSGPAVATGTGDLTGMELVCTRCGSLLCCWTALGLSPKHLSTSIGLAGRPTRLNHAITVWLARHRSDGRLRHDMFVERDVAGLVLGRTCGQLPRCYLPVHVAHPIRCHPVPAVGEDRLHADRHRARSRRRRSGLVQHADSNGGWSAAGGGQAV